MAGNIYVLIEKDKRRIIVHPSVVEAHKAVGWKVIKEGVPAKMNTKDKEAHEEPAKE